MIMILNFNIKNFTHKLFSFLYVALNFSLYRCFFLPTEL